MQLLLSSQSIENLYKCKTSSIIGCTCTIIMTIVVVVSNIQDTTAWFKTKYNLPTIYCHLNGGRLLKCKF